MTGPVTGGSHGWPFSLPRADLDAIGYVAEEFFLDGTATAYEAEPGAELGIDGKWSVRPSRSAPFRTRMLVVRPTDPARFNGIVHVNWQNVTAGFEIGTADSDQLLDGFAWVGVSAQRAGLEGFPGMEHVALKGWDPERYGTLDHPGDDFSFDIYTQAARATLVPWGTLGGLMPEKLVASGGSQSAMRLRTYANAIQPLEHVFDAFWFLVDFGKGSVPDTSSVDAATVPMGILPTVPVQIRDDLGVPALVFNSETEAPARVSGAPARHRHAAPLGGRGHVPHRRHLEPDGDGRALRARRHRVRARWHGGLDGRAREPQRVELHAGEPGGVPALPHLDPRWRAHRRCSRGSSSSAADAPTIRRDRFGNALGGIRLPDFAVPTGEHMGTGKGDVLASLVGYSRPFTPEELARALPEPRGVSQPVARGARPRRRGRLHPRRGRAGDEGGRRRDRGDGVPEIAERAVRAWRHLLA